MFSYKPSVISPLFHMDLLIFLFFRHNCLLGSKVSPAGLDGGIAKCTLHTLLPCVDVLS